MKKKGDRCKKFENLERDLLLVLSSKYKTVNEIRKDLEKQGIKASWNTVRDYLEGLFEKKKVVRISLGNNIKFMFWGKK